MGGRGDWYICIISYASSSPDTQNLQGTKLQDTSVTSRRGEQLFGIILVPRFSSRHMDGFFSSSAIQPGPHTQCADGVHGGSEVQNDSPEASGTLNSVGDPALGLNYDIHGSSGHQREENILSISGYKVKFPVGKKPFPAQFSVMAQVLRALHQSKNALIESPTGTGKTLALLCSTLSWQQHHILTPPVPAKTENCGRSSAKKMPKFKKIYFTSRTHSQIAQVVNALKRCPQFLVIGGVNTPVHSLKTTTLGSRQHYCVNPRVAKSTGGDLNEKCKSLVEKHQCEYRNSVKKLISATPPVWDIEDLVTTGAEVHGCPYYASRDMVDAAHIVFAPYNYLLDPVIRKAMDIDLNGTVVVIDEAHNVEDVSREAASCDLSQEDLLFSVEQLQRMIDLNTAEVQHYRQLLTIVQGVLDFVNERGDSLTLKDIEDGKKNTHSGISAAAVLKRRCGIHEENLTSLRGCVEAVVTASNEQDPDSETISGQALTLINKLVTTCEYMLSHDLKNVESFRLVISASKVWQRQARGRGRNVVVRKFCLWCMNPAVAFEEVARLSHSVILASGTLSPLDSFASELGVEFKMRLQATHVINTDKQLWAGAIGADSKKYSLKAVYENTSRHSYQDALGSIIYEASQNVPEGMLVFFPSYSLMDKIIDRWRHIELWQKLEEKKLCFVEPRSGKDAMEECMCSYLEAAKTGGAILFAVFRGKISEGVDFSDHNARAVFIVGIPYPAFKDLKVSLKRAYQDERKKCHTNSLSGSEWYSQQAYRALNQALGRCIRHRHDYGAIFLVDSRYCNNPIVVNQLSKWVRQSVKSYAEPGRMFRSVKSFFQDNFENPPGGNAPVKISPSDEEDREKSKKIASIFFPLPSSKRREKRNERDINRKPASTGDWISRKEAARNIDLGSRSIKSKKSALRFRKKSNNHRSVDTNAVDGGSGVCGDVVVGQTLTVQDSILKDYEDAQKSGQIIELLDDDENEEMPHTADIIAEEGKHMNELLRKRRNTAKMTREPLLLAHSTSQCKQTCCVRPEDLKCKAKCVDDDSSSDEAFEPVPKKKKSTSFQTRVF